MPTTITCPSGLVAVVRGLSADEVAVLANRDLFKDGAYMDEILKRCWVETSDQGPYQLMAVGAKHPLLGRMLLADRLFAYIQVRRQTWGDKYSITVQCPNLGCRERSTHDINLTSLPIVPVPESSLGAYRDGQKLEAWLGRELREVEGEDGETREEVVSQGARVLWHLPTGDDQKRLIQARKLALSSPQVKGASKPGVNPLIDALAMRIDEIEGLESKSDFRKFLAKQGLRDAKDLFDQMDGADGGVETEVVITCPHCDSAWDFDVPFGPEFIFPKTKSGPQKKSS